MINTEALFKILKQQAIALSKLLNPFCEVVVHDFSDLEHSIVVIEGNLTGRSIGGAPTDLLLSRARKGGADEDLYNYITSLPGGRLMKSSTIFLRDENDEVFGAFCVNFDISQFLSFSKQLNTLVKTEEDNEVSELFSDDIMDTIQSILTDTLFEMGESVPDMTRENKIELISRLHNRGVFQVKKAVPIVADLVGLSRATVYNYLREVNEED
ncbi:MAG: hypothetical protein A2Z14_17320 [Chloroflexi bacterium RBG_16_48_8]|nr:MAG: hypothetical protein A2Z14_17320 [Chloroflexi bacterium RBG_16_48_8]